MRTIKCPAHDMLVVVFESHEEFLFTDDLMATVVFNDSKIGPYLKRYWLDKCTEECPTVKKVFEKLKARELDE